MVEHVHGFAGCQYLSAAEERLLCEMSLLIWHSLAAPETFLLNQ